MTKRLFVSIALPAPWREILNDYHKQFSVCDVRWTAKENIHITVCFLGDTKEESVREIQEKLACVCEQAKPFEISFDKMDLAPPGMPPRMVWAVFKESSEYAALVKEMQEALKEFFAVEPYKELIAHTTLARFKDPAIARAIDVAQTQPALSSFEVRAVELVESHLDPAGIQHKTLETFLLGKTA